MQVKTRADKPSYGEQVIELIEQHVGPQFVDAIQTASNGTLAATIEALPAGSANFSGPQGIALAYASALSMHYNTPVVSTGWTV